MSADGTLTAEQTRALFDILTHHETYAEIEGFKRPEAVTGYGYPFRSVTNVPTSSRSASASPFVTAPTTPRSRSPAPPDDGIEKASGVGSAGEPGENDDTDEVQASTSPLLQTLFTRFVLPLPWLRDLPRDFWSVRIQGILSLLARADLSESYEKGTLGLRKTLATGSSALVEMVGRGVLGGLKRKGGDGREPVAYDHRKAEDLERAWDDAVQQLVYGDLAPSLFAHMAETSDLEGHSPAVKGAAEYIIVHLATFMHHIFAVSPEGQYLLQLLDNVHGLIPYKMLKQTLRIGNAATMINGMVKLLLAKLSVGSITNWVGLTANADDGMNLLQRIISLVLSWDAAAFRKNADRVTKDKVKDAPDEKILEALRQFVESEDRDQHDAVRAASLNQSQSIITAILVNSDPELLVSLSEEQHSQCLEYYSSLLSVRDRDVISAVLCRQQPDLFTQMTREVVNAYEPFLRMIHQGVDLREYLDAAQNFVEDFIKASRPKSISREPMSSAPKGEVRPPSVEDFVDLLTRNRELLYRWVHSVASSCPEVWDELEKWTEMVIVRFRPEDEGPDADAQELPRKNMEIRLNDLFKSLPETTQQAVREALNAHAAHLAKLSDASRGLFQDILDSISNPDSSLDASVGPGIYLSRWQNLLDETPITPELPVGPLRSGREVKHTLATGKSNIVGDKVRSAVSSVETEHTVQSHGPTPPDVSIVVQELREGFVKILQEVGGPIR